MGQLKRIFVAVGLLVFVSSFIAGCGGASNPPRGEYSQLANEAVQLEQAMNSGNLFKASSMKDRGSIKALLYEIKTTLLYLEKHPNDRRAYQQLRIALKELEGLQILSKDRAQLQGFTGKVYSAVNRNAVKRGIELEDFGWALFSYRFSEGVAPFASLPLSTSWEASWGMDESYVLAKAGGVHNWLISPTFDLTDVKDPAILVNHTIMLDRNNKIPDDFDRGKILKEAFQLVVSTVYKAGDDPNDPSMNWQVLNFKNYPNSFDFHYVDSPQIDLSEFVGKKITIAFHLHLDNARHGRHYPRWQIKKFQLIGQGELGEVKEASGAAPSLHRFDFKKETVAPFQALNYIQFGGDWTPFTIPNSTKHFAKAGSNGGAADTWLLSPIYNLGNQEGLSLKIAETVRNPVWENVRIKISTDYRGEDPRDATWFEVPRTAIRVAADTWKDLVTEVKLDEYKNQDIVVAFQFVDAGGPGQRVWEVQWLEFYGEGPLVTTETYSASIVPRTTP